VTEPWLPLAIEHLRAEPLLGPHIDRLPEPALEPKSDLFRRLCGAIFSQQLSTKAAATIENRFIALFPDQDYPTPQQLLESDIETLRSVGVSRPKAAYLQDLAARTLNGTLDFARIPDMTDEELHDHLIQIKGIGPWTVDMLMIFALHRPDVLPLGDLGVRGGFAKLVGRDDLTLAEMREIAEPWRPYRSAASWYLWRIYA
jgi:DNA-3-methyladenine glycosylase II